MEFAGLNYYAVGVAAVASYAFGAAWYMLLGKQWLAALGKTEAELQGPGGRVSPLPFVISFLAQLVMAFILAGVIGHLGATGLTLTNGVISGALIWVGFVATTLATNHAFQGSQATLTLIDGGHWLGVLILQGAIIGAMGL